MLELLLQHLVEAGLITLGMASKVYLRFIQNEGRGSFNLHATDDIRVALLMTNTTADTEDDGKEFVSGFTTLDEFDGANYVRKALANEAFAEDQANNRAEFDADDVTWTALGAGTRSVAGALVFKFVTNDADSPIIAWVEFSATPDGNDFTIQWNAEGIMQHTQA
jgi:hypothetical protein